MTIQDAATLFMSTLQGERDNLQTTLRREAGARDLTTRQVADIAHRTKHYLEPFHMAGLVDEWINQVLEPHGAKWRLR